MTTSLVDPNYLQVASELFKDIKETSIRGIQQGFTVADIGCGSGIDLGAMADRVGPTGRVIGVDADADMVEEAGYRVAQKGCPAPVKVLHGDFNGLPIDDGTLDYLRAERVMMYVSNPKKAIKEVLRVLKPGGIAVFVETDWNSVNLYSGMEHFEDDYRKFLVHRFLENGNSAVNTAPILKSLGVSDCVKYNHELTITDKPVFDMLSLYDDILDQGITANQIEKSEATDWKILSDRQAELGNFKCTVDVCVFVAIK